MVYALKFVLRAVDPRDVDLLLSMKHQPNIVIVGMARIHENIRKQGIFRPHNGRLAEDSDDNN